MQRLPRRIVLVGAATSRRSSPISLRGRAPTSQWNERLLPRFDRDLVGWLMHAFDALAIDVRTGMTVEAIEKMKSSFHCSRTLVWTTRKFRDRFGGPQCRTCAGARRARSYGSRCRGRDASPQAE